MADALTQTSRAPTAPGDFYTYLSANSTVELRAVVPATGTVPTLKTTTSNDAARTAGTMKGFSFNVEPGAFEAKAVYGGEVCMYAGSSATCTELRGLFVEAQGFGTIAGDWNALYVYSAPGANPSTTAHCVRIESNPSTITWQDSFVNFVGDPNFTFYHSGQGTAGASTGTHTTGQAGFMLVNMGGATRYIALYTS